jgi:hypothetical protein
MTSRQRSKRGEPCTAFVRKLMAEAERALGLIPGVDEHGKSTFRCVFLMGAAAASDELTHFPEGKACQEAAQFELVRSKAAKALEHVETAGEA